MKIEDVKKLTGEEIGVELGRLRERLYTLRTQAVTEKVEDNSNFLKTRRAIARLLTEQNARRTQPAPAARRTPAAPKRKPVARAKAKSGAAAKPSGKTKTRGRAAAGASR